MNIFQIAIYILSIFFVFFLESFFLKLFGFSVFVVLTINMWGRLKPVWFFVYVTFFGLLLDIMLHTALGMHMSVIATLIVFL